MKVRLLILTILAAILLDFVPNYAQDEAEANPLVPGQKSSAIYLGPVVGYNRSIHSVDLASFAAEPLCPFFTNGSSNGFHVGFFYEQLLGGVKSNHSLVIRALYNTFPASLSVDGDRYPSLIEIDSAYSTIKSHTKHTIDVSYSAISLDIMYKFLVFKSNAGGLALTVGPTFDIPMTKKLTQKYMLIEPLNVQFKRVDPNDPAHPEYKNFKYEDNDRTIIVYDGDIANPQNAKASDYKAASFRFGLKGGLQYEIKLGGKMDVIPGIFYNLGLTNATNAENWKISAIQASVDIRFAL